MQSSIEQRKTVMAQGVAALSEQEMLELQWAQKHLEHPSLAARMSSVLASSIEEALSLLPRNWRKRMDGVATTTMYQSLKLAISSIDQLGVSSSTHNRLHQLLVTSSGAAGGFFGPMLMLAELPLTTTLILRSIAEIAKSEGEDLNQNDARIACIQVFALGGRTKEDEDADLGYYALRLTLGLHFERDILEYATGAQGPHIPAVIDFVRAVAARFGVVITDKVAAQMVPIAGAVSGAMLNLIFIRHFQDVAKGHFIVRRLERKYGNDRIRDEYLKLMEDEAEAAKTFNPVVGW